MKQISSKENSLYREYKKLADKPGLVSLCDGCLIEGEKLIREAVKAGARVQALFVLEDLSTEWQEFAEVGYILTPSLMKGLSALPAVPSVIAAVSLERKQDLNQLLNRGRTFLVLDRIQDPGNLGSILRTAEGLGVDGVFLLPGSCSSANPKVLRAAMGSAFRMPVFEGLTGPDVLALCREHGVETVATAMNGTPLPSFPFGVKVAFFMGNEGQGLEPDLLMACDARVAIPQKPVLESLNVGAATAICLYERQRHG